MSYLASHAGLLAALGPLMEISVTKLPKQRPLNQAIAMDWPITLNFLLSVQPLPCRGSQPVPSLVAPKNNEIG